MLLEKKLAEEAEKISEEPNFYPHYRKSLPSPKDRQTLPPGIDVNQGRSLGVGNLTTLPVHRYKNEILSQVKHRDRAPDVIPLKKTRYSHTPESWQSGNFTYFLFKK